MKTRNKWILAGVGIVVVGGTAATMLAGGKDGEDGGRTVEVKRGEIVSKAIAVGNIEPDVEISVKSQISGVVRKLYVQPGDFVHEGDPLVEVKPNPTPLELAEAKRQVEMRDLDVQNLEKELERKRELRKKEYLTQEELDRAEQDYKQAALQVQMAKERLALLESGKVKIADRKIETVIRSPITGFVLEKKAEVGDAVVPVSDYQEGTALLTMAEMDHLLFRGTVDEIDVGKLTEGMTADIKIGALPQAKVKGEITNISLKAKTENNSTVFPVELKITDRGGAQLRAGYSANAEIVIDRRENVLVIPERLVTTEGDSSRVTLVQPDGTHAERTIRTGLSDAINVQVLSGLEEGEKLYEAPPRVIE